MLVTVATTRNQNGKLNYGSGHRFILVPVSTAFELYLCFVSSDSWVLGIFTQTTHNHGNLYS